MRHKSSVKKSLCQDPPTNEQDLLIKAAKVVIDTFKTPDEFLHFITDALGWVYDYGISVGDSHPGETHFILRRVIEEIAIPWLIGGGEFMSNMADGVREIDFETKDEFYLDDVKYIIKAYGYYIAGTGCLTVESTMRDMEGIICLMDMTAAIHSCHLAKKKETILA